MSWFENQIAYSKLKDDEALSETYVNIASAVTGRRIQQSFLDETTAAKNALEDICKYFKLRPREWPSDIKDINAQLDYVFQPCGITRRTVKLSEGWQKNAIGAMLGTLRESGKAIALLPGKMGGYTFFDPDTGKQTKVNSKNAEIFDDDALVFYHPLPLRPITLKDLLKYMQGCLDFSDLFWYFISLGAATLLGLLMPKLTNVLFSSVAVYGSLRLLLGIVLFMACQTISVQLINGVNRLLLTKINTKLTLFLQAASYMRVFSMPAEFFRKYTSGELNEHMEYLNQLCNAIVSAVFSSSTAGIFSLVYVTQIFHYSRSLVAPALLIVLATFVFSVAAAFINVKIARENMEHSAKEKGMVYSIITGIQKIRLCGAEKRAFSRWGNIYSKEAKLTYSPPAIIRFSSVIVMAIGAIGTVILYFVASKSGVSVADYYSFSVAYGYISAAFTSLAGVVQTVAAVKPVLQIIEPLMSTQPETGENKEVVTRLMGGIELSHIYFKYPDSDIQVLSDISLKIKPGQYVAIVGESGCGKSTLLRVLLGFENPQRGTVYYDGKDIKALDKKSLRRKIGVVMQNGKLMQGDIYSNITLTSPGLDMDAAWEAAEIAGVADYIHSLPMGMHTVIQEGSGGISGGQKQRIMIARAIAPKPKILFLDEATSALDNITQKKVCDALDKLKCTRVVVAHRLSTIRQCDRILFVKNGKICEDGSYEELIEKNGLFAELVKRQMLTPEK